MGSDCVFGLFWTLNWLLLFSFAKAYVPELGNFGAATLSTEKYSYDRIDEVKKQCASVLSSAAEFKAGDSRVFSIKDELTFLNGDWKQDVGAAPVMPYIGRDTRGGDMLNAQAPLNLVSFWVTDVDLSHRSKKSVSLNGFLVMGITEGSFVERPYEGTPHFQIWPGHTQLTMAFQGMYTVSKKNGGERVLCLLGSTMLPSRESESTDPWEWVKRSHSNDNQPPLLQDDQILLVLHYPMSFTLTDRVIKGELRSLNQKSNLKYFDQVNIFSQLGKSAKYEFGSETLVSRACGHYPFNGSQVNGGIDIYRGPSFCDILREITGEGTAPFTIVPNWRCNGTDDYCSRLGPFPSDNGIRATDGSFKGVKLFMQNVNCVQPRNGSLVRVAAVFRASSPLENQYAVAMRSGLSNMTVAAEGFWKSSSGQLCMVGCLGSVDKEGSSCNSRICLYVPLSFSIKQRSIIFGSFSSISQPNASYFPLSFEKLVQPTELWNFFRSSQPYYSYSKLDQAGTILEKNEPFSFQTVIKKSLLVYPKLDDSAAFVTSLSLLAEDLTLHTSVYPDPVPSSRPKRTNFQLEILSIGPLFGRYWSGHNFSYADEETPYRTKPEYTEKQLLVNVSAQITLEGETYSNFSVLFLEGLYDPHVGKMYLAGCRDVRASWNVLFESMDLEAGLDCLIEVVVSYPPATARWLVNPTASISISSQRTEDDLLHFSTVKLRTFPIIYSKQRDDILSRMGVEGILRILTLSFAIACILSQLFYIKHDLDSVPFISLVMLGVQALGYSLPLITGAEALFKRMSSESNYESTSYDLEKNQWSRVIDYTVKLLVMACFLLTLRLCQKVWKSRIRLLMRTPNESHRVPGDKHIFIVTLIIHVIGYATVLVVHSARTSQRPLQREVFIDSAGSSRTLQQWVTELEEYVGLVQDFFLLPQVIGNIMWQLDCKPLRELYYIGISVVRLLPHLYDYIRAPVSNPYVVEEYEFVNPNLDFYSKFGDVAIPTIAVLLAAAVFIQQRWSYEKLSQKLTFGQYRLLPFRSRAYERLPSKSFEAELASSVNGSSTRTTELGDEE